MAGRDIPSKEERFVISSHPEAWVLSYAQLREPTDARDHFRFDSLNDLMRFVAASGYEGQLVENEALFGFRLGAMIVALSEGRLDEEKIMEALDASTDPAYTEAASRLAHLLLEWRLRTRKEAP